MKCFGKWNEMHFILLPVLFHNLLFHSLPGLFHFIFSQSYFIILPGLFYYFASLISLFCQSLFHFISSMSICLAIMGSNSETCDLLFASLHAYCLINLYYDLKYKQIQRSEARDLVSTNNRPNLEINIPLFIIYKYV